MEKATADTEMIESMAKWFTTGESLLAMIFAMAVLIVTLRIITVPVKIPCLSGFSAVSWSFLYPLVPITRLYMD